MAFFACGNTMLEAYSIKNEDLGILPLSELAVSMYKMHLDLLEIEMNDKTHRYLELYE
jgi:hypothetical protein